MEEIRYLISDAAAKVAVEAHVLRYWEEELGLPISRTELGHRYYTEEDIRTFQNIKELKERGFQLKAIKVLLPEIRKREMKNLDHAMIHLEEKLSQQDKKETERRPEAEKKTDTEANRKTGAEEKRDAEAERNADAGQEQVLTGKDSRELLKLGVNLDKLASFESIMENVFRQTLQENNQELEDRISDSVLKGMDVLMQLREEREEARYRQLDESIRAHQKKHKLVAASRERTEEEPRKRKFLFFGK